MLKNGVSPSKIHLPNTKNPPATVFDFLCQKFTHILDTVWQERFDRGQVLGADGTPLSVSSAYRSGVVYYYRQVANEAVVPFCHHVLFENDDVMVVDKPHFLAVSPAGQYVEQTLLTRLKRETNNAHLSPLHRLDKDTAGLILISKNPATRHLYHALFSGSNITKTYHAIAPYRDNLPTDVCLHFERGEPFYTMRVNPDKPANTHTHIAMIDRQGDWAKYELTPTTGKLHQLRLTLSHLGIPIQNDPYYPTVRHRLAGDFDDPLQLLAKRLAFDDPVTGEQFDFWSSLSLLW